MSGHPDDMPFFDEPVEAAPPRQPGGIAARAMAARHGHNGDAALSRRAEPRAAAGGRDHRGRRCWCWPAPAPARRACSPPASPISCRHRPRLPLADPRRHLHQQGGARDEAARRPAGRRSGRGHAVARHLPLDRRQAAAPPRRARRAANPSFTILDTDDQVRLLRQIIQAEGLDDKRWAPRTFAQMIDGWKNKGLGPPTFPKATPAPSPTARAASSTRPTRTGWRR